MLGHNTIAKLIRVKHKAVHPAMMATVTARELSMMLPTGRTGPLEHSYRRLLALCDRLEAIADDLPRIDGRLCRETADALEPLVEDTHAMEEAVLFPVLMSTGRPELSQIVARLRQEHLFDSGSAEEVSECLRDLASGRSILPADAVGYLLRAFFEGMRRHVHGELDLLQLVLPDPDGKSLN